MKDASEEIARKALRWSSVELAWDKLEFLLRSAGRMVPAESRRQAWDRPAIWCISLLNMGYIQRMDQGSAKLNAI